MRVHKHSTVSSLLLICLSVLLLTPSALARKRNKDKKKDKVIARQGEVISLGRDLSYERGTAKAEENIVKFPYWHKNRPNKECWASIVHEGDGTRVITIATEAAGIKSKSKAISSQDFARSHPFQKTIDAIKQDALLNAFNQLKDSGNFSSADWKPLKVGGGVHKLFYTSSERRSYCFVAAPGQRRGSYVGPPVLVSFWHTHEGPLASALSADGQSWSPPQRVAATLNPSLYQAFRLVSSRKGF